MKNCENMNLLELVEKAKDLEKVDRWLDTIWAKIKYYYENRDRYYSGYQTEQKDFKQLKLDEKFSLLQQMIEAGNTEEQIKKLERKSKDFESEMNFERRELATEREDLLNAWNNFQNWKSQTSANLIKDLNAKFKENV